MDDQWMYMFFSYETHLSNERQPCWLGYLGDDKLPSFKGITINHYKDPYSTTNIMEGRRDISRGSFGKCFTFSHINEKKAKYFTTLIDVFFRQKKSSFGE